MHMKKICLRMKNQPCTPKYMNFLPRYYFLGFAEGAQKANQTLPQTIGWADYNNGGANGTFDPLAE